MNNIFEIIWHPTNKEMSEREREKERGGREMPSSGGICATPPSGPSIIHRFFFDFHLCSFLWLLSTPLNRPNPTIYINLNICWKAALHQRHLPGNRAFSFPMKREERDRWTEAAKGICWGSFINDGGSTSLITFLASPARVSDPRHLQMQWPHSHISNSNYSVDKRPV